MPSRFRNKLRSNSIFLHCATLVIISLATSRSFAQQYRVVRRVPTATARTSYRPVYSRSASPLRTAPSNSPSNSDVYRLNDGDTLAIVVDGVLGKFGDAPIHMPTTKNSEILPGIGYPVLVRNGALSLPLVDPIPVRGLTASQAQKKISNTYRRAKILKYDNRVMASLLRKRRVSVTVLHDDVAALRSASGQPYRGLYQTPRKNVSTVTLPADRAHLLDALSAAVVDLDSEQVVRVLSQHRRSLNEGDVVNVKSPQNQFFYAGGLLNSGQYPIPRDRPLNAMQAMAIAGGSFNSTRGGAFLGPSDLIITRQNGQSLRVDYERLRAQPNAVRIQPGDSLMLRYKPGEVIGNAAARAF